MRETQREERSLERTKRGTWLTSNKVDRVELRKELVPKRRALESGSYMSEALQSTKLKEGA